MLTVASQNSAALTTGSDIIVLDRVHREYIAALKSRPVEKINSDIVLTSGEVELLLAERDGLTRAEAALKLRLTPLSIKKRWGSLKIKLHARTQQEALFEALREGII